MAGRTQSAPNPQFELICDIDPRKDPLSAPGDLNIHSLKLAFYKSRADPPQIDISQTGSRTYNFKSVLATKSLGELQVDANSPENQTSEEIRYKLLADLEEGVEPLMRRIDNIIAETLEGWPRVWKLNTIIHYLGEHQTLERILGNCLAPGNVEKIGPLSYYHANGFDKYVLAAWSGWKLRLHIWWPEERLAFEENVHNHRWFFASNIITGTLNQNICEEVSFAESQKENYNDEDTEVRTKYISTPVINNKDHHKMTGGNLVIIKTKERIAFTAPSTYVFPMNLFHQVVDHAGGDAAMTLVLTAPSEEETSFLMAPCEEETSNLMVPCAEETSILATNKEEKNPETAKLVKRIEDEDIIRRLNRVISFLRGEIPRLTLN